MVRRSGREVGLERVVVGLIDEIGFTCALVTQRGEQPAETVAYLGVVHVVELAGSRQLPVERFDGGASLGVLRPESVHSVTQPWLRASDVGQETVDFVGVALFFARCFVEVPKRRENVAQPVRVAPGCGSSERSLQVVDGLEGATLVHTPRVELFAL